MFVVCSTVYISKLYHAEVFRTVTFCSLFLLLFNTFLLNSCRTSRELNSISPLPSLQFYIFTAFLIYSRVHSVLYSCKYVSNYEKSLHFFFQICFHKAITEMNLSNMAFQVGFCRSSIATKITFKRFLFFMNRTHMSFQVTFCRACIVTKITFKGFKTFMNSTGMFSYFFFSR